MNQEWLEDIIAVIDQGSLLKAASARNVTQPAFSRRLRVIEEKLGVELFDRSSRPLRLRSFAVEQQERMRDLVSRLRSLTFDLRQEEAAFHNRLVIASQHAITTNFAPAILSNVMPSELNFRLRSANREECYTMIMTRQADITFAYHTEADPFGFGDAIERVELTDELMIPVFSTEKLGELQKSLKQGSLPIVAYPSGVFLGRIMDRELLPRLDTRQSVLRRAETALTLAALELSAVGMGVSWVPATLADGYISGGKLTSLTDILPSTTLNVAAFRFQLLKSRSKAAERAWDALSKLKIKSPPTRHHSERGTLIL